MRQRSFNVVVTGGAPFKDWKFNTSAMVRDQMPNMLSSPGLPHINIIKYPHDVICKYDAVLDLVPKLWSGRKSVYYPDASEDERLHVDAMIQIRMHPEATDYIFETRARRDGYDEPGEDGKHLDPGLLEDGPAELQPDLGIPEIAGNIAKALQGQVNTKTSTDAGLYFCEFQFYTALAHLHKNGQFQRVDFFHVPLFKEEDAIQRGVSVACALAREMINSLPEDYDK